MLKSKGGVITTFDPFYFNHNLRGCATPWITTNRTSVNDSEWCIVHSDLPAIILIRFIPKNWLQLGLLTVVLQQKSKKNSDIEIMISDCNDIDVTMLSLVSCGKPLNGGSGWIMK